MVSVSRLGLVQRLAARMWHAKRSFQSCMSRVRFPSGAPTNKINDLGGTLAALAAVISDSKVSRNARFDARRVPPGRSTRPHLSGAGPTSAVISGFAATARSRSACVPAPSKRATYKAFVLAAPDQRAELDQPRGRASEDRQPQEGLLLTTKISVASLSFIGAETSD